MWVIEINYDEIEQATSKEFVELIKGKLSSNTVWKHFETKENEKHYCIDAMECYHTDPNTTYSIYHFQYRKKDGLICEQNFATLWIEKMIEKGWFDKTISQ